MTNFKYFRVGDLFDIHPTKPYKLTNDELYAIPGTTPVLSNSSVNNGIGGFVDRPPTEEGGIITFSDTTTGPDTMFYQPGPFIGYPHVQGMYPLNTKDWTEKPLLYFIGVLRKVCGNRFDYATKFNRKIVSNKMVQLPVDNNGNIDFEYMRERIEELERERIEELEHYLLVSGLDDYQLTEEDIASLSLFGPRSEEDGSGKEDTQHEKIIWKSYHIGDLFEKKKLKNKKDFDKRLDTRSQPNEEFSIPLVNAKMGDNGIMFWARPADVDVCDMCLAVIQNGAVATGKVYPEPQPTGILWDAYLIKPRSNIDENTLIFLCATIEKSIRESFTYDKKAVWGKVKECSVMLPSSDGIVPDYSIMSNYIQAQKKLAIRDVILMRDSIIKTT